ncbi:MAG: ABC transporter substrate-binding protein [Chloroflexota bacterium]
MKNLQRFLLLAAVLALFSVMIAPISAQDETPLGPGAGAPVVLGNFGGDIATLNPILANDQPSVDVINQLFPNFISNDPETGLPTPGALRGLAKDWSFNDDGTVMTVKLRTDWVWTDTTGATEGTPITSADVKYAYDAIVSGDVDSPIASAIDSIASVDAPDDSTVVITFKEANCDAPVTAANIPVVPSAYYKSVFPTFADMKGDNPANLNPETSAGAFKFKNFRAGEQVTLEADQNFPDSPVGHVVPQGFIYKSVTDQIVEVEQFLKGDITYLSSIPEDREADMETRATNGEFQLYKTPSTGWQVILFNMADPTNPQSALDDKGNTVKQAPHPIFGDVRVRQAFVHAVDHDALNQGAFSGTGAPVGGTMLPQSWTYDDTLQPYAFDPALSAKLLDEAGFVDDDNDPKTPRVANDKALYAKPGTPLEFSLTTFTGNPSVDSSSVLIQDELSQVGFKVNLDVIEFTPMLTKLTGQTYDALMVFWGVTNVNPNEMLDHYGIKADVVESGFNTGSYINPDFDALMDKARTLPGCDPVERKKLYDQAQEMIYNDVPAFYVNTSIVSVGVQNSVGEWAPKKNSLLWNLPAWSLHS